MIAIVDYGAGNLRSISRALQTNGADVTVTSDLNVIRMADRVVLPGVGNAKAAMDRLHTTGIADAVTDAVQAGTPLLGICLGMQLLFGDQEEGPTTGLSLLPGVAKHLLPDLKVPHMGWNTVTFTSTSPLYSRPPTSFYFVHSYVVEPNNLPDIAGVTSYGISFPSVIVHNHIWGMQFHPEKSGDSGLELLRTWLDWKP